jgi:hypothetical protein
MINITILVEEQTRVVSILKEVRRRWAKERYHAGEMVGARLLSAW